MRQSQFNSTFMFFWKSVTKQKVKTYHIHGQKAHQIARRQGIHFYASFSINDLVIYLDLSVSNVPSYATLSSRLRSPF